MRNVRKPPGRPGDNKRGDKTFYRDGSQAVDDCMQAQQRHISTITAKFVLPAGWEVTPRFVCNEITGSAICTFQSFPSVVSHHCSIRKIPHEQESEVSSFDVLKGRPGAISFSRMN